MKMIDDDNLTTKELTPKQVKTLKKQFSEGRITDCVGDSLSWEDCLNGSGNLSLDEDAFEQCIEVLQGE